VGHHMGRENHNRLLLLIPSLSLRYIFRSSIFPQAQTNVNVIETHFHNIKFKYKTAVAYTNSYFTCIRNLIFIRSGTSGAAQSVHFENSVGPHKTSKRAVILTWLPYVIIP
jgi:hypothetical protein